VILSCNPKSEKWIRLPFLSTLFLKLNRVLNQHSLSSLDSTSLIQPETYSHIWKIIYPILKSSGVYTNSCKWKQCLAIYISLTRRLLHERVFEHVKKSSKNSSPKIEFRKTHKFAIRKCSASLLHLLHKGPRLTVIKNLGICKHVNIVMIVL